MPRAAAATRGYVWSQLCTTVYAYLGVDDRPVSLLWISSPPSLDESFSQFGNPIFLTVPSSVVQEVLCIAFIELRSE